MMSSAQLLLGPLLVGAFLNAILYGVGLVQAYIYLQTYRGSDPRRNTWLLAYLLVAETAQTVVTFCIVYQPLVMRAGLPNQLVLLPRFLAADPLATSFVSTPIQLFLAWRIRVATGRLVLPSIIAFLSLWSLAGGIISTGVNLVIDRFDELSHVQWAIAIWLSSTAAADVAITLSMVHFLVRNKSHAVSEEVETVMNKILLFSVQTGALLSVAALTSLTVFATVHNTTLMFIWDLSLSKLYFNTFLSTLNARARWNNLLNPKRTLTDLSLHIDIA